MLTIILQSCAAAVAFTITAVVTLTIIKIGPNRREQANALEIETARANMFLRAAIAEEKTAYQLARIADQLEKNGK